MSNVINVENLGKKYIISHQQREEYSSLRDAITNGVRNLAKMLFPPLTPSTSLKAGLHLSPLSESEDFWALKDVSFQVKQGDRIGIIGRNGAGKSTLLKILSRITEPTTGSVRIKGRVASLLEVGTGFHPELTGRENIFLNGAILGMPREEIRRKFDEIVAFAEIEKFLDTPVKRYSSGMYVRLAFAVAAHLEPEILIVDEVLAVGDAQFQAKCLGKMEEVGKEGRTVLFVSHNMSAIRRLCRGAILLSAGQVVAVGEVENLIPFYLNVADTVSKSLLVVPENSEKSTQITRVSLHDQEGNLIDKPLMTDESFVVKLCFRLNRPLPGAYATLEIKNQNGDHVLFSDNRDNPASTSFEESGVISVAIHIPAPLFVPGKYFITTSIARQPIGMIDDCLDAVVFEIENIHGVRANRPGYIYLPLEWQLDCRF